MRGRRKLHNKNEVFKKSNNDLKKVRNERIAWRFYYHSVIKRERYDDAINNLTDEFFLSPEWLATILMGNKYLEEIELLKPSINKVVENCKPFLCEISQSERVRYLKFKS